MKSVLFVFGIICAVTAQSIDDVPHVIPATEVMHEDDDDGYEVYEENFPISSMEEYPEEMHHDDDDEPLIRCKRPLCEMFCTFGFHTDKTGCEICQCLDNPCKDVTCDPGRTCHATQCEDQRNCVKLNYQCIGPACAEPMCANRCPTGYKTGPEGCMTCTCNEAVMCGTQICEDGQVCREVRIETPAGVAETKSICTAKPLCHSTQERAYMVRSGAGIAPVCEDNGAFKPLQCVGDMCWCVDDRGVEIDGTRKTAVTDNEKPACLRNITVAIHVKMLMVLEIGEDIAPHMATLNGSIGDHISAWLLMERDFIIVTRVSAMPSTVDSIPDGAVPVVDVVMVEFVALHDGVTDLPSAAEHMQQRMRHGKCRVPLDDRTSLKPDPNTVVAEHQFLPTIPDTGMYVEHESFCASHRTALIAAAVGSVVLLCIVVSVSLCIKTRRTRLVNLQFQHRRLQNMASYQAESLVVDDPKKEVSPDIKVSVGLLDDGEHVITADDNKVSIA